MTFFAPNFNDALHICHVTMRTAQRASLWSLAFATRGLAAGFAPYVRIPKRNSNAIQQSATSNQQQALSFSTINTTASFYGGDYAGLSATFSATTGSLIPVPEYLVPDVLLEWGQGPSCLEVIVSEDVNENSLARHTVSVVPDVGCGVDNLDVMKSQQTINVNLGNAWDDSVIALDYSLPNNNDMMQCETTFLLDNGHRMRVMIDIEQQQVIKTPITLVLERKTSNKSSAGTIADGGGLDGRTVSRLLGDLAKGKLFCEVLPLEWNLDDCEDGRMTFLTLPGNVTISLSTSVLRVGHVMNESSQRVVTRRFGSDGTVEYDYSTETK